MLIEKNILNINKAEYFSDNLLQDTLFFDIETTGFSPKVSNLYLIGCLYFKEGAWNLVQWFADDYVSEENIITEFFNLLASFKVLAHYNGTSFDIPYIQNKLIKYNSTFNFSEIESFDLYKEIKFLKPMLQLTNLKQKTVEEFLGISRKDTFDGGELISIYCEYMQNKLLHKPYEHQLKSLLLHNKEDLLGLLASTTLLKYSDFLNGAFQITKTAINENYFRIYLTPTQSLPNPLNVERELFSLSITNDISYVDIKITKDSLKYFYKNYKDYYYLPQEDTAIHKSVATYVDTSYRQKAKISNCYTHKEGLFLPQYKEIITPVFQKSYKAKPYYFELTETLQSNYPLLKSYLIDLFKKAF